ncbi:hemolysin family protein [Vagococcus entomophilus]|uniref:Hemolysin n=1 Tax=Vagococcus entomophilus TaxID=1160095 RepID=A0A430AKB0_9ENTE|nr:hemolysin family protein [Vagococcus entomophilus]RSU08347.1 hemolysin [Vagococcus entomophilus]
MNADPESQSLITQFLILIILTLLNAFFAAAETALISVNKNRIEQKAGLGNKQAKKLLDLLEHPNNFLSTIQVGITLMTILSGASLAESLAQKLTTLLGGGETAAQIASVLSLIFLTYISIVFGELYPKRIALNKSEEVAMFTMWPVQILGTIARPFVWLLSASTDLLGRLTPMKFDDADVKMTREEMRYMLVNEGVLDSDELEMVQGVFSLDTKVAREIMVPRTDAFMINVHDTIAENIDLVLSDNYSRIPVYDEDKDKVIGILHLKNLLKAAKIEGFENVDLLKIIQEPLFVPETIFIDDLLYELKKTQNQMAILLDEYGGVVGLVTLEDLLEEIVGEIEDESDEVENLYSKIDAQTYLVQGRMLIDEFNELFHTELEMSDVDTIAGYFITALGTIPDQGEKLSYQVGNLTLISEEMEGSRLLVLKAIFSEEQRTEDLDDEEERHRFRKDKNDEE